MTWLDKRIDRLLLRLMPTFSRVLWWLPELIAICLFGAIAVVTASPIPVLPGVIVLAGAVWHAVEVRRANRRALRQVAPVDVDDQAVAEDTDLSGVSP
nr:hypothetical protein [Kibdelosporangium sp. MJ126-NF4]CEL23349.1 hypothetical protein [Kibdelosporangium sp. MJ126-NF4]CTQ94511.1 hypothetical protein [Kibdelosporangium sp. MJ126-NF4]